METRKMPDNKDKSPYDEVYTPPPPPFPKLTDEAKKIVDLEEAVRWERANRGISMDGIDDWKRKDIIIWYAFLVVVVIFVGIVLVTRR
jgi:hypothetical protein